MPYWIWTPEFDINSRTYFVEKKSQKRGPFYLLIENKEKFLNLLESELSSFEKNLHPFYKSDEMTLTDIILAAHLWGMYIFPEFQFSPNVHSYLQKIKKLCHFDYHADFMPAWGKSQASQTQS